MANILVVASHPDDEILGGGATFAKLADAGNAVRAVVLSEGATARYAAGMAEQLRLAAEASAAAIGFASLDFLNLPDQRLDHLPLIEITQSIEPIISEYRPEIVFTHSEVDVNLDHGVVARAVWTACRPYSAPWVNRILAFETPSSTEWAWPGASTAFLPQTFVDVTGTIDRKVAAMECYSSELRDYPHPRSIRALRERAATWGSKIGVPFAEPFVLLRERL